MAVTLSVADQENGGGVIATVTGTGTITVEYYVSGTGWETLGSRSGSGTVSGTTTKVGLLWWVARTATEVSLVVPATVTRNGQAVYDQCLQAVQDTIQLAIDGGGLSWLEGTDRQRKLRVDAIKVDQPAAVIVPGNPSMEPITSDRDQLTYPCQVFIINSAESNQADDDEDATIPYHLIHERVRRLFSQQRLAGVSRIDQCRVVLGNHFEWQANGYEQVQTIITVNCLSREARGI